MKPTYEVIEVSVGGQIIKRTDSDGQVSWIPTDPANSDYQAHLAQLANPTP